MTAAGGPDGRGHELGLGLDFGSTAVRAAFGGPGGPVRRFTLSGPRWPWLLCEPAVTGPLPVAFPSLKSRLGSGRPVRAGGVARAPEEVVTELLREVRERAEAEAGGRITQTVVSVPASYDSGQRTALLDAARAAGLGPVRLIGDAMAAVIGHTEGRGSTTCLVYGLGYGGFELGLVRGARERYRALGHESASTTGGRAFDDAALTGMLRAAGRRANPDRLAETDWLRLRARVERIREEIGTSGDDGLLELDLGGGMPAQLQFGRAGLVEYLERHVRRTLNRAQTLLDQSGMDRRDVDTLLLVGGGTRLDAVRAGVQGLGRELVTAPEDLLATGALWHASQLAGAPPSPLEGLAVEPADTSDDTLAEAPRLSVTLLSPPPPAAPASESEEPAPPSDPGVPLDVALARRLAEHGRVKEARALLETILSEARTLLESLEGAAAQAPDAPPPETAPVTAPVTAAAGPGQTGAGDEAAAAFASTEPTDSEYQADRKAVRRLTMARDLLTERRYEEAVQASHAAWQAARDGTSGADVLDAMIGVHCAAAMADFSPEHFPDAERWLRCAYGHDPTNARVRELLAERTYRHAERLEGRGRLDDAVEALEQCLTWNPEHAFAHELLERISRRGRNHRDRGGVPR
ncbi:Hsp70 family protein [Streptomyces spinosisporus]|uniref:Hsp70 family protein n=1 Tax=Streptomyces spinosisporus TaxID=2927582 RepID=A0ABS9X8H0_9ACTN|nr:Hsp70 family protein [Streptomyces spinosisporus]MCI3238369.1 Hsp70 family protein [Streptomyces spinosisporus]